MKKPTVRKSTALIAVSSGVTLVLFGVVAYIVSFVENPFNEVVINETNNEIEYTVPTSIVTELGIQETIHDYLKNSLTVSAFGDEVFCSFEVLGHDETKSKLNLYLWTLCSELYVADGEIKEGGGVSEPLILVLERTDKEYTVTKHIEPERGITYAQSAQNIFPEEYHSKVLPDKVTPQEFNERTKTLSYWVKEQGKDFYGVE